MKDKLRSLLTRLKVWAAEKLRRMVVALKRKPSTIPMLALVVCLLVFSLNLTLVSNTTAKIQGAGMGLAQFSTMLFSILSMVCMINAFPRRKKPVVPMVVLLYVMLAIIVYCDIHYLGCIDTALNRADSPIIVNASTAYIPGAQTMLIVHIICVVIAAALIATLPLYTKQIAKIKTSVNVAENEGMGAIELSE